MLQLQPTMLPQGGASLRLAIAQYCCRQNLHLLEICRRTSPAVPAMRRVCGRTRLDQSFARLSPGHFEAAFWS
jgi:hypothetical protein